MEFLTDEINGYAEIGDAEVMTEAKSSFRDLTQEELITMVDKVKSDIDKIYAYSSDKRMDDSQKMKKLSKLISELKKSMD